MKWDLMQNNLILIFVAISAAAILIGGYSYYSRLTVQIATQDETNAYAGELRRRGIIVETSSGRLGEYLELSTEEIDDLFAGARAENELAKTGNSVSGPKSRIFSDTQAKFMNVLVKIGNGILSANPEMNWKMDINSNGGLESIIIHGEEYFFPLSDHLIGSIRDLNAEELDIDAEVDFLLRVKKRKK